MFHRQIHAPAQTADAELTRLRLTVAKVRDVYEVLRTREASGSDAVDRTCRAIANAIEDALIDGDYEAAAGETEEGGALMTAPHACCRDMERAQRDAKELADLLELGPGDEPAAALLKMAEAIGLATMIHDALLRAVAAR